jgi:hypothetical protein
MKTAPKSKTKRPREDRRAGGAGAISLPITKRGRRSETQQAAYDLELKEFADRLIEIRSSLDFKPGKRGWCYILEEHGLTKDEFDRAGECIDQCRKTGLLPIDFTASDENRAAQNLEDPDRETPEEYAQSWVESAALSWNRYDPGSLWDFQDVYIEMAVEKIDLRSLFGGICAEYRIPIWNCRGWSDINSRAELMGRFRRHSDAGRHCVLLYCGDHDPSGLLIAETIRKNLHDLTRAVGWVPDEAALTIDRFGLNYDFIETNGLSWNEGLETSSGGNLADAKHKDHFKSYVQDYIRQYGERKVEANALVTRPDAGRDLCREAIGRYLDLDRVREFRTWQHRQKQLVRDVLPNALRSMTDGGEQ